MKLFKHDPWIAGQVIYQNWNGTPGWLVSKVCGLIPPPPPPSSSSHLSSSSFLHSDKISDKKRLFGLSWPHHYQVRM